MASSSPWLRLLKKLSQGTAPLRFAHGMRHEVEKGNWCGIHSHAELEIVYHSRGNGVTRLASHESIRFEKGGTILYAPDQPHDQLTDSAGEDICLQIEIPASEKRALQGCLYVPPAADPLLVAEIEVLTLGPFPNEPAERTVRHLRSTAVLLSLLHAAFAQRRQETMPRAEHQVMRAERYLRDHFQTIEALEEVARHVGLSQDRLRHLFRQHRGRSMIRFLNEVRMERARSLLVHSRLPLKQIATLSGFRDEYYFSSVFRHFHRVPPGAYREAEIKRPPTFWLVTKKPPQKRRLFEAK